VILGYFKVAQDLNNVEEYNVKGFNDSYKLVSDSEVVRFILPAAGWSPLLSLLVLLLVSCSPLSRR
jgi:hypothetical protein